MENTVFSKYIDDDDDDDANVHVLIRAAMTIFHALQTKRTYNNSNSNNNNKLSEF